MYDFINSMLIAFPFIEVRLTVRRGQIHCVIDCGNIPTIKNKIISFEDDWIETTVQIPENLDVLQSANILILETV